MPDTVQDVILTRVDRLPEAARRTLDVASVIGSEIAIPLLQDVAELSRDRLDEGLEDLRAAELLYDVGQVPGQEYAFKHAVIQEVVYGQVPANRRRELHAQLVDAIERLYAERPGEHVNRLAYHASRGERWPQALAYARQAAARARAQSAYREMAAFLEQAVGALEHLPQTSSALEQGVDLRFELRDAHNALREPEVVLRWLGEAEALAQAISDPLRLARAASYMSQYFWVEGKPAQAIEVGQRALGSAIALGDLGLQVATAFYLGRAHHAVGDYSLAIQHLSGAVASLEGGLAYHRYGVAGFPSVLSRIWLAWCYAECGRFGDAITCGEEALQIAAEGNDPFTRVGAYLASARARLRLGDVDVAITGLEQSLGLARSWDIPVWVPIVSAELGGACVQAGQLTRGIRLLEETLSTPWKVDLSLWTSWLSEGHLRAGRLDEATGHAVRALELARAHGQRGNEAHVCRLLAEISSRGGERAARAEDLYRQGLALAADLGMHPLVAHCHRGLGTLYRQAGDDERGAEHLTVARHLYRDMGMSVWLPQVEAALAGMGEAD